WNHIVRVPSGSISIAGVPAPTTTGLFGVIVQWNRSVDVARDTPNASGSAVADCAYDEKYSSYVVPTLRSSGSATMPIAMLEMPGNASAPSSSKPSILANGVGVPAYGDSAAEMRVNDVPSAENASPSCQPVCPAILSCASLPPAYTST